MYNRKKEKEDYKLTKELKNSDRNSAEVKRGEKPTPVMRGGGCIFAAPPWPRPLPHWSFSPTRPPDLVPSLALSRFAPARRARPEGGGGGCG